MKKLLLVDADPLSLCVLEVGLRKAGFIVTTATDAGEALQQIEAMAPDVVVTDTRLFGRDGFSLVRDMRERQDSADIPVVFLASHDSEEDRSAALDLGIDAYLAKPVYLAELAARIQLLLARRARISVERHAASGTGRGRLGGSIKDLALVDLLQSVEASGNSGVALVRNGMQEARIFFRDGKVVDAELGALRGEEAIYRALIWDEASFDVEFKPVNNDDVIECSMQSLVMKSMRRVGEWVSLCDQVQPLATLLDVHPPQLLERLSSMTEIPDAWKAMLRLPVRAASRPALSESAVVMREDMLATPQPPAAAIPTVPAAAAAAPTVPPAAAEAPTIPPVAAAPSVPPVAVAAPAPAPPVAVAPAASVPPVAVAAPASMPPVAAPVQPTIPTPVAAPTPSVHPVAAPTPSVHPVAAPAPSVPPAVAAAPTVPPVAPATLPPEAPVPVESVPPAAAAVEVPRHAIKPPPEPEAEVAVAPPPAPIPVAEAAAVPVPERVTLADIVAARAVRTETPATPAERAPAKDVAAERAPAKEAPPKRAPVTDDVAAPAAAATQPARVPSLRPSAAPWTREVGSGAEVSIEHDELAAGVPRAMSAKTKLVGAGVATLAVVVVAGLWLSSVSKNQMREAEAARSRNVAVVGTTAFAKGTTSAATAPVATASSPVATADIPEPQPVAEVEKAVPAAAPQEPVRAPGNAAPAAVAIADKGAPPLPAAAPAAPPGNPGESAIDVRYKMHSQSPLVRDAQSALLKGDTVHAMELAQKAVVTEPGDADGWLTLAAARKASGDLSGAAEAYKGCIAKAQTVGVTNCRVLGGMH